MTETEFERHLSDLIAKALADTARQQTALRGKVEAEAELLGRVIGLVKPALPSIAPTIPELGRRGIELIDGQPGTTLFEDGTLVQPAAELVAIFNIKTMLERLATLLEKQGRGRAADKANVDASKVRLILAMLREKL